jgi:hypothetical protein
MSRVVASAILINYSTVTTAAAAISSNCSIPTVLTDCSISTALDLYYCWIYFTASSARSTVLPNYPDQPVPFYYFH